MANRRNLRWNMLRLKRRKPSAQILLHYLENYAIAKGEHQLTGKIDRLARAPYAAYNDGPRQWKR